MFLETHTLLLIHSSLEGFNFKELYSRSVKLQQHFGSSSDKAVSKHNRKKIGDQIREIQTDLANEVGFGERRVRLYAAIEKEKESIVPIIRADERSMATQVYDRLSEDDKAMYGATFDQKAQKKIKADIIYLREKDPTNPNNIFFIRNGNNGGDVPSLVDFLQGFDENDPSVDKTGEY